MRIFNPIILGIIFLMQDASCSASHVDTDRWVVNGPGTLSCTEQMDKSLNIASHKITFRPDLNYPDAYWCNVSVNYSNPLNANTLELLIRASSPRVVTVKVVDSANCAAYYSFNAPDGWARIKAHTEKCDAFEGGSKLRDIASVQFIFNNSQFDPNTEFSLYVAGLKITSTAPPKPKPFLNPNWMPAKIPAPVKGYRIETCIWNTWDKDNGWGKGDAEFNGYDKPEGIRVAKDVMNHLVDVYHNIAIDMPYVSNVWGKSMCSYLQSLGGIPFAEGHNAMPREWLAENNAFAINILGQNIFQTQTPDSSTAHDMTNPIVLKALQERILTSARAGAKAWRTVDYVWPWYGGPVWGYSDSAIKRWRENLNGTDTGIEVIDGKKTRTAHFMEYFESYHGYRPKPAELGLNSWNDYFPPKADAKESPQLENNHKIFALLFHYEWVKFINEAARPSAPLGLLAQPICNPEFYDNGTDLYWLLRCAFVRGFAAEWWGLANVILTNYYNGRYYDNIARANAKELVNLGESAAAGGSPFWGKSGRPHYWDNMANYLINYSQAASVDFKAKHDQYWGSSWKKMSNPKGREYQSFTAFRSAWSGFLQCRNDRALKPKTDLLAIGMRTVSRATDSFDRGMSNQEYNLARYLYTLNYLHDGAAFPMDGSVRLDNYRTILYSPFEPPQGFAAKLSSWLISKSGRTLITHSFVPSRFSAPAPAPQGASGSVQPGSQEKLLGFDGIVQSNITTGILRVSDKTLARTLKKYIGKEIRLAHGLYETPGGKVLAYIGGKPLISERKYGKSRIIYLHFLPLEKAGNNSNVSMQIIDQSIQSSAFERAVIDGVLQYAGYKPSAITPEGCYALTFDIPKSRKAFSIYNSNAHLDMKWGGEIFNVFQAQDHQTRGTVRMLAGAPGTKYKVTDMITGKVFKTTSDASGYVLVSIANWNMRGVYIDRQ